MNLPSSVGGTTTETIGLFEAEATVFLRWLVGGADSRDATAPLRAASLHEVVDTLRSSDRVEPWRAVVPLQGWTLLLTGGPLGTDVGTIPSLAARELSCLSLRALATEPTAVFPAVVLEVFDPSETGHLLRHRRSVVAAKDGSRWVFEQAGEPFDFEDRVAYRRRRVRDRFTAQMLHAYLAALGVPSLRHLDVANTVLVDLTPR